MSSYAQHRGGKQTNIREVSMRHIRVTTALRTLTGGNRGMFLSTTLAELDTVRTDLGRYGQQSELIASTAKALGQLALHWKDETQDHVDERGTDLLELTVQHWCRVQALLRQIQGYSLATHHINEEAQTLCGMSLKRRREDEELDPGTVPRALKRTRDARHIAACLEMHLPTRTRGQRKGWEQTRQGRYHVAGFFDLDYNW